VSFLCRVVFVMSVDFRIFFLRFACCLCREKSKKSFFCFIFSHKEDAQHTFTVTFFIYTPCDAQRNANARVHIFVCPLSPCVCKRRRRRRAEGEFLLSRKKKDESRFFLKKKEHGELLPKVRSRSRGRRERERGREIPRALTRRRLKKRRANAKKNE
jgi:hypothetical protein